jgi:hypothetical protein
MSRARRQTQHSAQDVSFRAPPFEHRSPSCFHLHHFNRNAPILSSPTGATTYRHQQQVLKACGRMQANHKRSHARPQSGRGSEVSHLKATFRHDGLPHVIQRLSRTLEVVQACRRQLPEAGPHRRGRAGVRARQEIHANASFYEQAHVRRPFASLEAQCFRALE